MKGATAYILAAALLLGGCAGNPAWEKAYDAYEAGRWGEALPLYEKLVAEQPNNSVLWWHLGRMQLWKGQNEPAARSFEQYRALNPIALAEPSVELARLASKRGDLDGAATYYTEAIANYKDRIKDGESSLIVPVWVAERRGQLRKAEAELAAVQAEQRKQAASQQAVQQVAASSSASPNLDAAFWESVKTSSSPSDLQAYLRKFPNGTFADLARARLTRLGETPVRLTPVAAPAPGTFNFGRYHALVIGINNYKFVQPLKTAINDARAVGQLLGTEYGFDAKLLIDPNRDQMLDAFDDLRRTLTETDNLLIYYAGHGVLDRDSDRGFWLPVDAHPDRRANWLSNSDIADMVRATRAKHVLVVADSCYAGTLTRNLTVQMGALDDFTRLAQRRARTALVSGGLEPVEDAGGGSHSVFAKAFLDQLRANSGVVDMSQIFSAMRRQVILAAQQTPQYGDIRQTGHEGGDFIFVRQAGGK